MALLPWSNLKLCTVANIRTRLQSPEIILAITAGNDTRIGFTASGDTLTTGIPHGLVQWSEVTLETAGTLPPPLAIATTYYAIVLNATSIKVASVIGGSAITLTGAGTGQSTLYSSKLDALISSKIALTKVWIYMDLVKDFQRRVPEVVQTWRAYKGWQVNNAAQQLQRDVRLMQEAASLPNIGANAAGSVLDLYFLLSFSLNIHPRTFSSDGVPTNGTTGTWSGTAVPGDFLIDSLNERLYVNRGTAGSPLWTHPTVQLCLDNLMNVGSDKPFNCIQKAAEECCMWAMAQDGAFRNSGGYTNADVSGYRLDAESMWRKRYKESIADAISLFEIDFDGSGEISDFTRSLTSGEIAAFG